MEYKKKLIEVALPLEAINKESVREKSIRHGHPSTLHLWWARRPLAACRAVLFAQLVDDPSSHPDKFPTEEDQTNERERLFKIIEDLVKWENVNNEKVLNAAKTEILKSTDGSPPSILDPFCGGGSIPLEAQRLGLKAFASDLNPVAVLITKALIEIPPKFAGMPPVNPKTHKSIHWEGAKGLAEDVRYYGNLMRNEAEKRIGHLYPKVKLPKERGGGEATVIAWIWVRAIKCPNPACGVQMPLARSFWLSKKKNEKVWIEPTVDYSSQPAQIHYKIISGNGRPQDPPKLGRGSKFKCLVCGNIAEDKYIKNQGISGGISLQLMAIVAEGQRGQLFVSPSELHNDIVKKAKPFWKPDYPLAEDRRAIWCPLYGLDTYDKLFTPRQLEALTTFSDLVMEVREQIKIDAVKANMLDDNKKLDEGGLQAASYADAIAVYLGFAVDRSANYWSSLTPWGGGFIVQTFGRQALPMVWDFAEANPFSASTGNWDGAVDWIIRCIDKSIPAYGTGIVKQLDAASTSNGVMDPVVCTDPPYYDNIGYADLSDFFYIWLRRSIGKLFPILFSTLLVPKAEELVATPYRFNGNKEEAKKFFEKGLGKSFEQIRKIHRNDYPVTVYYAFKQAETKEDQLTSGVVTASTGWETMLEGLLNAKLGITGTWPLRTERDQGLKTGTNVLASSIILACRPKDEDAVMTTRRDFINVLKQELPLALRTLQQGNIAPVDLAQSAIGPGMAVFSRYEKVLEADGAVMRVRSALSLINQILDEFLMEQEGEYDADTRWALAWFEQHGVEEGPYGVAETLSIAKNTSVEGLVKAGILKSKAGKVQLFKREEFQKDWDPTKDKRLTVWEVTQYLIRALVDKGSEETAADLLKKVGGLGDSARDLAYRLYTICERKKWAQEALAYNSLVVAWPELIKLAGRKDGRIKTQEELFDRG